MLEADSALISSDGEDVFEEALRASSDEIISCLGNALVLRRTRLYNLATRKLDRKDLEDLNVTGDRILDEKAFEVCEVLKSRNIPIPSALRTPSHRTTVFHYENLSPTLGESLHGHGFIDVDSFDGSGLTPLMRMGSPYRTNIEPALQRVTWLISKGADPRRKPDKCEPMYWNPSSTAAHYICSWVGVAIGGGWRSPYVKRTTFFAILNGLDDDCQSLSGKLWSSKSYDGCLCACSSHGCTPVTMMLKGIRAGLLSYVLTEHIPTLIEGRSWIIDCVETLLGHGHEAWQWLSREIIQYETFEKLELTHTCCEVGFFSEMRLRNDDVDGEEVRDEERLLIRKLDALVAEFQEKYTELGVTVSEFLKGYWKNRMEEVEREEESVDEEEIARIKDVGVVIHS